MFPIGKEFGFKDDFLLVNKIYVVIDTEFSYVADIVYVTFAFIKDLTAPPFEKQDFFKWRDENKATGFINNDMVDSLSYSLKMNYEKYLQEKNEENFREQHKLPRKVIFNKNKKATTLLYGDEATVVKACKGDKFDKEKGFLMAFFQKQTGLSKTQAKKYLKKITEEK